LGERRRTIYIPQLKGEKKKEIVSSQLAYTKKKTLSGSPPVPEVREGGHQRFPFLQGKKRGKKK